MVEPLSYRNQIIQKIAKNLSGEVYVKVLIDFEGKVISAEPTKGQVEFFEVSTEAAKKARFKPTTLSGKPTKVSGVIVYRFTKQF